MEFVTDNKIVNIPLDEIDYDGIYKNAKSRYAEEVGIEELAEHIKKNEWDYPDSNKLYTRVQNDELPFFKTYDAVDFHYKTGDKNYIIHNVSGVLFYDNNIEDCYDKMDSIIYELTNIFPNAEKSTKDTWALTADKSGKSKVTDIYFTLEDGHEIVSCYDYSKEFGDQEHLDVGLDNEEVFKWLQF